MTTLSSPSRSSVVRPALWRPVLFLHLACAVFHEVESPLALAVHDGTVDAWYVVGVRRQTRAKSMLTDDKSLRVDGSRGLEVSERFEWGEGLPPLYCDRCSQRIVVDGGALWASAQRHPEQPAVVVAAHHDLPLPVGALVASMMGTKDNRRWARRSPLNAYVDDLGEVIYRLDDHAKELARRDDRARRTRRQPSFGRHARVGADEMSSGLGATRTTRSSQRPGGRFGPR